MFRSVSKLFVLGLISLFSVQLFAAVQCGVAVAYQSENVSHEEILAAIKKAAGTEDVTSSVLVRDGADDSVIHFQVIQLPSYSGLKTGHKELTEWVKAGANTGTFPEVTAYKEFVIKRTWGANLVEWGVTSTVASSIFSLVAFVAPKEAGEPGLRYLTATAAGGIFGFISYLITGNIINDRLNFSNPRIFPHLREFVLHEENTARTKPRELLLVTKQDPTKLISFLMQDLDFRQKL